LTAHLHALRSRTLPAAPADRTPGHPAAQRSADGGQDRTQDGTTERTRYGTEARTESDHRDRPESGIGDGPRSGPPADPTPTGRPRQMHRPARTALQTDHPAARPAAGPELRLAPQQPSHPRGGGRPHRRPTRRSSNPYRPHQPSAPPPRPHPTERRHDPS